GTTPRLPRILPKIMPKPSSPSSLCFGSVAFLGLFAFLLLPGLDARGAAPPELSGEQIYRARCARCHGPRGEGSKKYKRRLEGDQSVAQLAELIGKTMPENAPGTLSAKQARAVAEYAHAAFYSKLARERNRPARVELARLTVRQYRQAVTDLVGSFRS